MSAGLEATGVAASYGRAEALHGVDLRVTAGECVACVGANGAGKSTLLRVIGGLHRARAGKVLLHGDDVTGVECALRARAGLALVPEGRRILPLTVGENLRAGQLASGQDREAIEAVLERFPILRERWDSQALSMSGGEQQMLAIGRALVSKPSMIMFDEPTLGLAPVMIDEVVKHVEAIVADGTTVLLVEQNLHVAIRIASRLYVLRGGRVIDEVTTQEADVNEIARLGYVG